MWDRQKTDIFNKIKAINPNAKASNYENKTANEMLKILQSYKNRSMKFKSSNKSNKSDKDNKDNSISNKDYDTDESTESKFGQGLEYYALKDIDTKSFDILEKEENKLEEVSRNDMLAKAKSQTITRYNKAPGYKGFSIVDIDTTSVFTTNSLRVTCRVGDYWDTVEMENILYWIQVEAEKNQNYQINTKGITAAIMNSIDGMDIKVDCTCPDFKYRFAYMATKLGYKYGKPENREAKITNPNDYGSICKHLISMLSNKKWLQQVTSTVMDFIVKRIDDVNKFLRVKEGEELTLPNELARQNAKKGFYTKLFGKDDANNEQDEENNEEDLQDVDKDISNNNEDSNNNNNTIDNQSNVDTEEDSENNEK